MRPLTKNDANGPYVKYYPSVAFLPSVALGALLTTNFISLIEVEFIGKIGLRPLGPIRPLGNLSATIIIVLRS